MSKVCRFLASATVAAVLLSCNHGKGDVEGTLEFVDSTWDPGGDRTAVPGILVHLMPGDESRAREILASFAPVVSAGIPGRDVPGLVEHVQTHHVADGEMLEAAETDGQGRWSFARIPEGSYLVIADYSSDLGYFAWLVTVEVQGTRTAVVDLTYDNRLPIVMPIGALPPAKEFPALDRFEKNTPPPPIEVEIPGDQKEIIEKLEKLGGETVPPAETP